MGRTATVVFPNVPGSEPTVSRADLESKIIIRRIEAVDAYSNMSVRDSQREMTVWLNVEVDTGVGRGRAVIVRQSFDSSVLDGYFDLEGRPHAILRLI